MKKMDSSFLRPILPLTVTPVCVTAFSARTARSAILSRLRQAYVKFPAKMTETNAIIGGESSGGLAVRGHISGKDGIYAAALLVEMLAVTGKKLSALYREIEAQYGALSYAEASFTMTPARKLALQQYLFEQHACPEFECVDHISREDGCKVYFTDGSWVICRFSGTEPLLRMAAEAETDEKAQSYIRTWKAFLSL